MRRPCALPFLVLLTACGASQRVGRCRVTPPPGGSTRSAPEPVVAAPADAPATPSPQPVAPAQPANTQREETRIVTQAASEGGDDGSADVDCAPSAESPPAPPPRDEIAAHEESLRRNLAALVAGAGECREVCLAAGSVCVAAGEICRLAGDGHERCARARSACTDAGRRRDGACPVCPTPR